MLSTRKLNKLVKDLSHPDPSVRRAAAHALEESDERAVHPLLNALKDENPGVQDAIARALSSIGGETVAYMLIPLLREDSYLRNTALVILKDIGKSSVRFLYPLLKDKDADMRKFALDLMGEIKEGVDAPQAVPLIKDPNANVRAAAVRTVGLLKYSKGANAVVDALNDEEWVAFAALETLGELKDPASIGRIAGIIKTGSAALRAAAIETLGNIGHRGAADALSSILPGASGEDKASIIRSLLQIGVTPSMAGVADEMMRMLLAGDESDWDDRLLAMKGLAELKYEPALPHIIDIAGSLDSSLPEDEEKFPAIKEQILKFGCSRALISALEDPKLRYKGKVMACEAAGEMACLEAVPALIELSKRDERDVGRASMKALGMMKDERATGALIHAVTHHDSHVRKTAIGALGCAGGARSFDVLLSHLEAERFIDVIEVTVKSLLFIDAQRFFSLIAGFSDRVREAVARFADNIEVLGALASDGTKEVRVAAVTRLGNVGGQTALDIVLKASKDADAEVRRAAAAALGDMDTNPENIKSLLKDPDMWVRLHAVRALGRSLRQDLVGSLKPMLQDREVPVLLAAVEALARIGGREAFGVLSTLLEHENDSVRQAAVEALENL